MRTTRRTVAGLLVAALLLLGALVVSLGRTQPSEPGRQVRLDEAQRLLAQHEVTAVTLLDHDSRIALRTSSGDVWAAYPADTAVSAQFLSTAIKAKVPVRVDQQPSKQLFAVLAQFVLPLLLLAALFGLFIVLARGGGSQVKEMFAFSRLRTRTSDAPTNPYRFGDVAAADDAIEELAEVRDYLRDPARFAAMGALPPKGVLLFGPPGCGKTLLARALAGEAGVPFFYLSGSEFVESLVGVGAARVRDLFRQAVTRAPAIVFIDELDAAGRRRGAGVGGGNDEREQTLNEMLVQMDGFAANSGVVVIGATNRPDILDPALLRPGRFDRHVVMETPDLAGRQAILRVHTGAKRLAADVDLALVAKATPGFSGADLAGVMNEGALLALRRRAAEVSQDDLLEGVQRVLHGARRRGTVLTEAELRRLAYHEAGHAVVAHAVDFPTELTRNSIVSRGRDLGRTQALQTDRVMLTVSECKAEVAIAMAGCAAERLVLGEASTAGESDLELATDLARRYVGRYGFSEQVGLLRVLAKDAEVFLGRDLMSTHNAANATLDAVDDAARALITEAEEDAARILAKRRRVLDTLAQALLEHETLDQPDLLAILDASRTRKAST
jgi:cell division protease FtsH